MGARALQHFNPRSLAGATHLAAFLLPDHHHFNPRSLAGATRGYNSNVTLAAISIHAPLRERPTQKKQKLLVNSFQSTLPCGSDAEYKGYKLLSGISIHAPLRERPIIT